MMNEWRMLRDIRKGDVCDDGSVITTDPVQCPDLPGYAVYAVRDTDGVTHTDYWAWDEELRMQIR